MTIQKNGRMYIVVVVLGMVSHAIHLTKGRALTIISTCNLVNKDCSLKFVGQVFDTNVLHILLDGVTKGYNFLEPNVVML